MSGAREAFAEVALSFLLWNLFWRMFFTSEQGDKFLLGDLV